MAKFTLLNLKIFEKKAENQVLFQPRIEWWYQWNKTRGTLPKKYQKMGLMEVFDDLGAFDEISLPADIKRVAYISQYCQSL
ncbi:hypothetical protein HQ584_06275 [Patescibacteria group bacterium]|nr:hypothetical protein [Patescibacteria group bacterium]